MGSFSNGYCSVTTFLNIVRNVTPNPATGSQSCSLRVLPSCWELIRVPVKRELCERFVGGHTVWSSSTAATVRPVSNVSPAAAPRTAPPSGIGGTGNPPS